MLLGSQNFGLGPRYRVAGVVSLADWPASCGWGSTALMLTGHPTLLAAATVATEDHQCQAIRDRGQRAMTV